MPVQFAREDINERLFMRDCILVIGTHSEAIKMCPQVNEFQKHPEAFETIVCVTGWQIDEMKDEITSGLLREYK